MSASVYKIYPKEAYGKADTVLETALGRFKDVIVIGYDHDGELEAAASNYFNDGGNLLWAMEKFKFSLLAGDYEGEVSDELPEG